MREKNETYFICKLRYKMIRCFTGVKDLDRKILEKVEKRDYLSLLLTNKYLSSLFDDIFFRNKLKNEFDFNCKTNPKKYYNIVVFFNKIHILLEKHEKICISVPFLNDNNVWKMGRINHAYSKIIYSLERDEISLFIGVTYDPVLFTTNMDQSYEYKHEDGKEIKYDKYCISKIQEDYIYSSGFVKMFIFSKE